MHRLHQHHDLLLFLLDVQGQFLEIQQPFAGVGTAAVCSGFEFAGQPLNALSYALPFLLKPVVLLFHGGDSTSLSSTTRLPYPSSSPRQKPSSGPLPPHSKQEPCYWSAPMPDTAVETTTPFACSMRRNSCKVPFFELVTSLA